MNRPSEVFLEASVKKPENNLKMKNGFTNQLKVKSFMIEP
jgi:hypothetical protein